MGNLGERDRPRCGCRDCFAHRSRQIRPSGLRTPPSGHQVGERARVGRRDVEVEAGLDQLELADHPAALPLQEVDPEVVDRAAEARHHGVVGAHRERADVTRPHGADPAAELLVDAYVPRSRQLVEALPEAPASGTPPMP